MTLDVENEVKLWTLGPVVELTPVLSAALDAFLEQGYHGASVRDIARRVGINVPALYYQHENKESILFELLMRAMRTLHGNLVAVADSTDDPVERMARLAEALVRYVTNATRLMRLGADARSLGTENAAEYVAIRSAVEELMHQSIEEGVTKGHFQIIEPALATRAILGICQSLAAWYRPDGELGQQVLVDEHVTYVMRLLGVPDELRLQRQIE